MILYVDADACPVKPEIIKVAERHNLKVIQVADGGLRPSRDPMVQNVIVTQGADAADDWIAENIGAHDICITNDIPLAKRCLEKQAKALKPNGKLFDEANIGMALAMREINQHIRESQNTQTYNAGFTQKDRSNFLQELERLIQQGKRNS